MRFRWFCLTLCAGQFGGCENPRPTLTQVEPRQAYSDHDVRLTLVGDGFLPATTLNPATGSRVAVIDAFRVRMVSADKQVAAMSNLTWQSTSQMSATLSSASTGYLPIGLLDVELTDPRGQQTTKDDAFDELGPDLTPPVVAFTSPSPSIPVGPGTILRGNIHADATPGIVTELHWTYSESKQPLAGGECSTGAAEVDCPFQVQVSSTLQGGEPIELVATALDDSKAQIPGSAPLAFIVLARPTIASVWPSRGGTTGGTDIVITGSGFLDGSQASLDGVLLFPNGGIVAKDHNTLSGHVPAHAEGSPSVIVQTPIGVALGTVVFRYLPPPLVATIAPDTGTLAGGTKVLLTGENFTADTRIYFGSTLDSAVPLSNLSLQSERMILGSTPAGSGQTTVWAWDEALGFTRLLNGFTWRAP